MICARSHCRGSWAGGTGRDWAGLGGTWDFTPYCYDLFSMTTSNKKVNAKIVCLQAVTILQFQFGKRRNEDEAELSFHG